MGMVFQNYAVWPHKTVYENIVFGLKLRKVPAHEARARVETALALVEPDGARDRLPSELSGGQQQRVALARSLVVEPVHPAARRALEQSRRQAARAHARGARSSCSAAPASPSSTSPTTRPRRWRFPTRSPSSTAAGCSSSARRGRCTAGPPAAWSRTSWASSTCCRRRWSPPRMAVPGCASGRAGASRSTWASRCGRARPSRSRSGRRSIRLQPPTRTEQPHLSGKVGESTFLGNIADYQVALDDDTVLRVQTHPLEQFAVGEAVAVLVDRRPVHRVRGLDQALEA